MEKLFERLKLLNRTGRYIILGAVAVILIVVILLVVFSGSGKVTVNVETSLKEIIEISELKTAEYTYNSIAEVKDGDTTKYYVSYKGTVSAGVDFEAIKVDRKGSIICITIPAIEILSVNVNTDMEYIFIKDKYDTENTYSEAYNVCCRDLEEKAKTNSTLIKTAEESVVDTIKALTKPFERQLGEGEVFDIVFETFEEDDDQ